MACPASGCPWSRYSRVSPDPSRRPFSAQQGLECVSQLAQDPHDHISLERAQYLFPVFLALNDARFTQDCEMTGDHRQIDTAPSGYMAHGARTLSFRDTHEQGQPLRIGERLEESRREQLRQTAMATLRPFAAIIAHLYHKALPTRDSI